MTYINDEIINMEKNIFADAGKKNSLLVKIKVA